MLGCNYCIIHNQGTLFDTAGTVNGKYKKSGRRKFIWTEAHQICIHDVKAGAKLVINCALAYNMMAEKNPVGSRKRIELRRLVMNTFAAYSIANFLPEQLLDAALNLLGVAGSKFEIAFDEGAGVFDAWCYARDMANYRFCVDLMGQYITASLVRFANMGIYSKVVAGYKSGWPIRSKMHTALMRLCCTHGH